MWRRLLPLGVTLVLLVWLAAQWMWGPPHYDPLLTGESGAAPAALDLPCVGNIITADEGLRDQTFAGAVILVCHHDQTGALGVVLNRVGERHVRSVVPHAPVEAGRARWGGPVGRGGGVVVYRDRDPAAEGEGEGLRFTTAALEVAFPAVGWARAPRVAWEDVVAVFVGHAGWGPAQLEAEVEGGAWVLTDEPALAMIRDPGRRLRVRPSTAAP